MRVNLLYGSTLGNDSKNGEMSLPSLTSNVNKSYWKAV